MMYYPLDEKSLLLARMYASFTVGEHTYFHKGWDNDKLAQFRRVCDGQMAQHYVINLLKMNGANVEEDPSDYMSPDSFDFKIGGYTFDVKSSAHPLIPLQASLSTMRKKPHYFIFCRLDLKKLAIAVCGVVKASEVFQDKYFVKKGEVIPNTDLAQQFEEGSYFYTGEYKPLKTILDWANMIK